jgi:uncharacterized protein YodC (DUF2158 family)
MTTQDTPTQDIPLTRPTKPPLRVIKGGRTYLDGKAESPGMFKRFFDLFEEKKRIDPIKVADGHHHGVGHLVYLRSGGPLMTVKDCLDGKSYLCSWMDRHNVYHEQNFPHELIYRKPTR